VKPVNKHTRAGKQGKEITCPCGKYTVTVYHFAWSAITCGCGWVEKQDWSTNIGSENPPKAEIKQSSGKI
jgi:hypothetical protein